jgi:predicted PurR-regulated permease PerM
MVLSFQKLFFVLAFLFGLFAVMVFAKSVLIPLSMALLISFILLPVVKKLEYWGFNNMVAALISILMIFVFIVLAITLFSAELMSLSNRVNDFTETVMSTLSDAIIFINQNIYFLEDLNREELIENGKGWIKESSGFLISNTFSGTTTFLAGIVSTSIFTFLFLIYRKGLTKAMVAFGAEENKPKIFRMLQNVQHVGKKYLSGMFLLIIILGFANSIGLWIIGIDSPFLFGFFAAVLSVVPFVGTTIGAIIPVLYAFMSTDSLWTPFAVIILFWVVQVVESNFLSPKVVGGSLNVNAFVAILSLLIGASVWGIAGMILFLPFAAMLKVVCEEFDQLKPVAMLISNDISEDNTPRWQLFKWFKKIKWPRKST